MATKPQAAVAYGENKTPKRPLPAPPPQLYMLDCGCRLSHRGQLAESVGSSRSPFEQVAPQSPGEGSLGERTSESTEPQGHAHAHSRGIGARGSRARESVKPPPRESQVPSKADPQDYNRALIDSGRISKGCPPPPGIPTTSHTRASGELGRSASLLGPGFVSSSHCGFSKGLKKKKQIRVPAVGMPEVFWARGKDLPK